MDGSIVFFVFILTTIITLASLPYCMKKWSLQRQRRNQGVGYEVVDVEDESTSQSP